MTTTYDRLTAAINESIRTDSRVHVTIPANNADDVRDLCYTAWADMLAEQGDEESELDCDVEVIWDDELEAYSARGWTNATASEQEWLLTVEALSDYDMMPTESGWAVCRSDGSYAEFLDAAAAEEASRRLVTGEAQETDYDWYTA